MALTLTDRVPLGRDVSGAPLAPLRDRLVAAVPATNPLWWLVYLALTAAGGVLRFGHLATPASFVFDETYYAKDAWSLLHFGTERSYLPTANAQLLAGHVLDQWAHTKPACSATTAASAPCPEYVVHPPVGKWMIALGERAFGMTPFGWRFVPAVCGTIAILLVGRLARRLTRSDLLGALAALLYAVDGLAIVEARTAILDSLLAFWLLLALSCLLIDRDVARRRLADRAGAPGAGYPVTALGPRLGIRWWRWAAGLFFGLGCATKWNGVFLLAVMGVLTWLWDASARRAIGLPRWLSASFLRDAPGAFLSLVGTSVVVYVASWSGWFATTGGYDRSWAASNPAGTVGRLLPSALRSWWNYHQQMYQFDTNLSTPHPYASNAIGWLVMYKPVAFAYTGGLSASGVATTGGSWVRAVHAAGTPLLWWGSCVALQVCVWLWAGARDWRAGFVLAGVLGTWVPWLHYSHRTIFSFYAIVVLPVLVLAVVLVIGRLIGPGAVAAAGPDTVDTAAVDTDPVGADPVGAVAAGPDVAGPYAAGTDPVGADAAGAVAAGPDVAATTPVQAAGNRRVWAGAVCGVYIALVVVNSAYAYPILTDELIPYSSWLHRMWFKSWI